MGFSSTTALFPIPERRFCTFPVCLGEFNSKCTEFNAGCPIPINVSDFGAVLPNSDNGFGGLFVCLCNLCIVPVLVSGFLFEFLSFTAVFPIPVIGFGKLPICFISFVELATG